MNIEKYLLKNMWEGCQTFWVLKSEQISTDNNEKQYNLDVTEEG